MNPIKKIFNSFRGSSNQEDTLKQRHNSISNDFLRNGNRKSNQKIQIDKNLNENLEISGWVFSSLNIRSDNFSQFCIENLLTESEQEENPIHPYLKLIKESVTQSEYEFWRDLISDYDMYGQAFMFVLRRVVYEDEKNPDGTYKINHIGQPISIEVLDSKNVTVLRNHLGKIVGYREMLSPTMRREFLADQVIQVMNHHPKNRTQPYSLFDACRDYQYTISKGAEFAQNALLNNMNTPGILSTPEILNDEEYDNLMSRINSHQPGQIIVSDGTGQLHYEAISQDLDKSSLPTLNDISRQTIFAVMGTSKTILGIEESGTTRETAKVQDKKFINKTIAPLARRFVSALNFDYRTHYPSDFERTKQKIEVKSIYDPTEALEQFNTQKILFDSTSEIVYSGYTKESAEDFMYGNIAFTELEQDESALENTSETSPEAQEDTSNTQDGITTTSESQDEENEKKVSQNDFDERMFNKWFSN